MDTRETKKNTPTLLIGPGSREQAAGRAPSGTAVGGCLRFPLGDAILLQGSCGMQGALGCFQKEGVVLGEKRGQSKACSLQEISLGTTKVNVLCTYWYPITGKLSSSMSLVPLRSCEAGVPPWWGFSLEGPHGTTVLLSSCITAIFVPFHYFVLSERAPLMDRDHVLPVLIPIALVLICALLFVFCHGFWLCCW